MKNSQVQRHHFIDLLRGWSVLVMLEGHILNGLLREPLKATTLYRAVTLFNGQIAPTFLFVSGFAFAIAAQRKWKDYLVPGSTLLHQCRKLLGILAMAYLLHLPTFSFRYLTTRATPAQWQAFFQTDVLHCIAVGLLLLQLLLFVFRRESLLYGASAILGLSIPLLTPLLWRTELTHLLPYPVAAYLSGHISPLFPLFPWMAYVLFGASSGHFFLQSAAKGEERKFITWTVLVGGGVAGMALLRGFPSLSLHPEEAYWESSPFYFFIRLGLVFLSGAVLWFFVRKHPPPDMRGRSLISLFGLEALFVYIVHIVIVYGSKPYPTLVNVIGPRLNFLGCVIAFGGLTFAMYLLARVWNWMKTEHPRGLLWFKVLFATAMAAFFFLS